MRALDTNVLVRLLTDDHAEQATRAQAAVASGPTWVPLTVLLETACVLRTAYGFDDRAIADAFRILAGLPLVTVEHPHRLAQSLDLVNAGLEIADALHIAASSAHCNAMLTFDTTFIRTAANSSPIPIETP